MTWKGKLAAVVIVGFAAFLIITKPVVAAGVWNGFWNGLAVFGNGVANFLDRIT